MIHKYKAWDKNKEKFIDLKKESYVIDLGSGMVISLGSENELSEEATNIELLSSTGVVNIQKEEIFEGDVVKTHYGVHGRHIGVVEFSSGEFKAIGVKQYWLEHEGLDGTFEVIGNKYEHPQLIEFEGEEL
ncbi:YopX family protein [Staphylococcus equorum]|uniref:YopX protein domain-containing protein n=1 Tax=Staphylococcus equorum TaxID=246432 RepID=A0AAP7LV32_9STAP|nr:YopX family protein [Staphylococcus equorum]OEK58954.1 hypothetical protein ASS94_01105 [Staphylococcus equorum]